MGVIITVEDRVVEIGGVCVTGNVWVAVSIVDNVVEISVSLLELMLELTETGGVVKLDAP